MRLIRRLASIVDWIFHRQRAERALDDELQAFLEISAAEKMRGGLPPDEARRLARLELGGVEQVREQVRTYRHGGWLDEIGRDVRYAFRMFLRTPGFTFVVVLTLALGIGANTAIFSLIDALMLRWLPVRNPQELVQVAFQPPTPKDSPAWRVSAASASRSAPPMPSVERPARSSPAATTRRSACSQPPVGSSGARTTSQEHRWLP
jgi:hypothetical protein